MKNIKLSARARLTDVYNANTLKDGVAGCDDVLMLS
jgi:hypothetical protein